LNNPPTCSTLNACPSKSINTFKRKLEEIGFDIPDNYAQIRPGYDPIVWSPRTEAFLKVVEEITKGVG
jgi:hypothetical protein